jgi:hypothetical protein
MSVTRTNRFMVLSFEKVRNIPLQLFMLARNPWQRDQTVAQVGYDRAP